MPIQFKKNHELLTVKLLMCSRFEVAMTQRGLRHIESIKFKRYMQPNWINGSGGSLAFN